LQHLAVRERDFELCPLAVGQRVRIGMQPDFQAVQRFAVEAPFDFP
jgi:hypothetical protein